MRINWWNNKTTKKIIQDKILISLNKKLMILKLLILNI